MGRNCDTFSGGEKNLDFLFFKMKREKLYVEIECWVLTFPSECLRIHLIKWHGGHWKLSKCRRIEHWSIETMVGWFKE